MYEVDTGLKFMLSQVFVTKDLPQQKYQVTSQYFNINMLVLLSKNNN